jgi:hypothetical protein
VVPTLEVVADVVLASELDSDALLLAVTGPTADMELDVPPPAPLAPGFT